MALLILAALAIALLRRQVVQLPQPRIAVTLGAFVALLAISTLMSSYKMLSFTTFAEWATYALAFLAVIAVAGRDNGPKLICAAFVTGCSILALEGLSQYISQADPTWRIFALWQEPNALAGILVIGLFTALGLGYASERLGRTLCLLSAAMIGMALLLTGSKGALVSAAAGFLVLFLMIGAYAGARAGVRLGYMVLSLVGAVALFLGAQRLQQISPAGGKSSTRSSQMESGLVLAQATSPEASANSLTRVFNSSSNGAQSMKFRENLWRSSVQLIQENPMGYGFGTFSFYSAKPGLTTQTQLAHESYLQIAVEANPLAAIAFVVFLLFCAFEMLRSSRKLPEPQNLLRAGIFAALFASCIHNAIDSDFYQMGIGLSFFILLGVGLQLASDAVVPEFIPGFARMTELVVGVVATGFLFFAAIVQLSIENVLNDLQVQSSDLISDSQSLRSYAGWDPRVWYATFQTAQSAGEAEENLQRSLALGPEQRVYRTLAQLQAQQGHYDDANATLVRALRDDPNNLFTLKALLDLQKKMPNGNVQRIAQRLVDIEKTDYFNIRALPEIVPTETYEARLVLSDYLPSPLNQVYDLRPAIDGYLVYAKMTVPMILKFAPLGLNTYGRVDDARANLELALKYAKKLETAYRAVKNPEGAQWAVEAQRTLEESLKTLPAQDLSNPK